MFFEKLVYFNFFLVTYLHSNSFTERAHCCQYLVLTTIMYYVLYTLFYLTNIKMYLTNNKIKKLPLFTFFMKIKGQMC